MYLYLLLQLAAVVLISEMLHIFIVLINCIQIHVF